LNIGGTTNGRCLLGLSRLSSQVKAQNFIPMPHGIYQLALPEHTLHGFILLGPNSLRHFRLLKPAKQDNSSNGINQQSIKTLPDKRLLTVFNFAALL
jgi:hypothetical protein